MKKLLNKKNFYILVSLFVLFLFAYITYKTPLAGDDWGYALNGNLGTPIKSALEFYNTWSGRFFSELWGMIVPSHKWLWNIINPLLFLGIFICLYKLTKVSNKYLGIPLLIMCMMLVIEDNMRMETYTWIMGTTYIIPLFLSLLYFLVIDELFSKNYYDSKLKIFLYLDNICLFIIGLMMENIAATMIVGEVVLIIYAYFNKKKALRFLIINLIVSIVSFVIMRLSPGSTYRLLDENASWANMSIIEKIINAYPNFIEMTFTNNYAIIMFSVMIIILLITLKKEISTTYKVISIIISIMGLLFVLLPIIDKNILSNLDSTIIYVFWPIYVVNAFITIYFGIDDSYKRDKTLYLLMIGGCSSLVMLYSPIYGSRSAIYLFCYLILISALIFEDTYINKKMLSLAFIILFALVIINKSEAFIRKYKQVAIRQEDRLSIIQYYVDNPGVEEAWIPRFPKNSIHGGDIEIGDTYHFETFKEYYNLPQDADKIIFYWYDEDLESEN